MTMQSDKLFAHFQLGDPKAFAGMTVFPVIAGSQADAPSYLTSTEAFSREGFQVSEVSESGSVPNLTVRNDLDRPVLLLDGEELVGAKQNRVLNTTVLVPAQSELTIPVSCVEQGRWARRSPRMEISGNLDTFDVRSTKFSSVSRSLKSGADYRSDQGEVWRRIYEEEARDGARSQTGAMREVYQRRAQDLSQYVRAFGPVAGQVGILVAISARWSGLEFFGHSSLFQTHADKIIRSFAASAAGSRQHDTTAPAQEEAKRVFEEFLRAEVEEFPAVGLGQSLRIDTDTWDGARLEHEDELIHAVAFGKRPERRHRTDNDGLQERFRQRVREHRARGTVSRGRAGIARHRQRSFRTTDDRPSPEGFRYPATVNQGHLVVRTPEGPMLLDTGSPQSFSRSRRIQIGGRSFSAPEPSGLIDPLPLRGWDGRRWQGLIGMDVLREFDVLFDLADRSVLLISDLRGALNVLSPEAFDIAPTQDIHGVPTIEAHMDDTRRRFALDTCAPVCYLPQRPESLEPTGQTIEDYFPMLGTFESEIYRNNVVIGSSWHRLRFGVLPPLLGALVEGAGLDGLLGVDLFRRNRVILASSERRVLIERPEELRWRRPDGQVVVERSARRSRLENAEEQRGLIEGLDDLASRRRPS